MALPAIVWGVLELVAAAITAYEVGSLVDEIWDGYKKYGDDLEKAKGEIRKLIESIKKEIDLKIEEKEEVMILLGLAENDPQSQRTEKSQGRGSGNSVINTAIARKIPFRDAISQVCATADKMPIFSLRKKKGVDIKDLPKAKRLVFEKLIGVAFEEIEGIDLEGFILVRLKQLAVNHMFEFIDNCLDWTSPLKAEVSFGPPKEFTDHPVEGTTKLQRLGDINPFYPPPHRKRGSIAADLMIPEYRHQRPDKANIFAIVEIKFQGDRIEVIQFERYLDLLRYAAIVKTTNSHIRFKSRPVKAEDMLSLFRYPEDIAVHGKESNKQAPANKGKKGSKGH